MYALHINILHVILIPMLQCTNMSRECVTHIYITIINEFTIYKLQHTLLYPYTI